jgi:2,4-dienoyl-CoA reductase-like NADH-dependent reductase (Old Yellow Enzyme family)
MQPLSASAVPITDSQYRWGGVHTLDWEFPKAMTQEDINAVKTEYVDAAKSAREAGFDGIEVHGANGLVRFFTVII